MNNKAFQLTAAIYFFAIIIFGGILNYIINIIRNEPFSVGDLVQVFTLGFFLTLGMILGLRAKLKSIFKYLNTEIEVEPRIYISETTLEVPDINVDDLSNKLIDSNYSITYIDKNKGIIKICSELKPLRYGSAATLKLENNSINTRSFRVGDNNKKRLTAFTEELIRILKK